MHNGVQLPRQHLGGMGLRGMKSQKEIGCIQAFTDLEERKKKKKKRITERATIDELQRIYFIACRSKSQTLLQAHALPKDHPHATINIDRKASYMYRTITVPPQIS